MRADLKHLYGASEPLYSLAVCLKRVHPPLKGRRVLFKLRFGDALISHQRLKHAFIAVEVSAELILHQGPHFLEPLLEALPVDSALLRDLLDLRGSVQLELLQPLEEWPACGLQLASELLSDRLKLLDHDLAQPRHGLLDPFNLPRELLLRRPDRFSDILLASDTMVVGLVNVLFECIQALLNVRDLVSHLADSLLARSAAFLEALPA